MRNIFLLPLICTAFILLGCGGGGGGTTTSSPPISTPPPPAPPQEPEIEEVVVDSLHQQVAFPIGVAVAAGDAANSLLDSPSRQAAVEKHFDSLTAENIMKPSFLHPQQGEFFFEQAQALLDYAQQHNMQVHGHTLIWHRQLPQWMTDFQGDWPSMYEQHIVGVASHFAGSVVSWDVVNEVFDDAEPTGLRDTLWLQQLGPSYVEQAFVLAHQADNNALLYYNDYNIAGVSHKLDAVLEMVEDFQQRDIPIHGIGFQMHINLDWPSVEQLAESFQRASDTGLMVRISELDIAVNPQGNLSSFSPEVAQRQEQRYQEVIEIYIQSVPAEQRGGITVWGVTDLDSWIPGEFGNPDWPLLFNDDAIGKPALRGFYQALLVD